jgi:hypothetical protein
MAFIEMAAGRTIPLQLLLYALVLLGLLRGAGIGIAQAAGIGFIAGLALLNRFDAVLLPLLVAGMIGWLTRSPARALTALAAAAVAVSPWIAYSLTTFGTLFATDNAGIATALDPAAFVTDWWPTPQPSLADDPLAWAAKVAGNVAGFALTGAALLISAMGLAAAAFLAPPAALAYLEGGEAGNGPRGSERLWVLAAFTLLAGVMLAPQVLTGYLEYRYFTALLWAAFLTAACWGIAHGRSLHQRMIVAKGAFALAGLAVAVFSLSQWAQAGAQDSARWASFDNPADVRALQSCVQSAPGARILVLGDDNFAARAGALGGLATMMAPRNMAQGRLDGEGSRAFITAWQVDYVLAKDPARAAWARATFRLVPVQGCSLMLYRVAG